MLLLVSQQVKETFKTDVIAMVTLNVFVVTLTGNFQ